MHPSTLSALAARCGLSPAIPTRIEGDSVLLLIEGVWYTPDADALAELLTDMAAGHVGGDGSDAELIEIVREQVPMVAAP